MKKPLRYTLVCIFGALAAIRLLTLDWAAPNVLTWDSFGYYLYLPGHFIYHDLCQLDWLPHIVETYRPTPHLYQTMTLPNGCFAMKYLMGLSILYLPFFGLGHLAAGISGYPQDGFSVPYQLSVCLGSMVYACAGLWLVGKVLRRYFPAAIAAIALVLLALATNFPEYTAIEAGQTHGYLFAVYALQLWLTVRWHERPTLPLAFFIGLVVGLASITRPTEGIMLFIPLLWQAQGFDKWKFLKENPSHLLASAGGAVLGVLPQLIYWKSVTGQWVFDVGSKWFFLNPWWRVLFGWEKGWFIYTPITIFMVAGLFWMKGRPFRQAVLTFFILNTWIIISWSDWRYGGSYSTRALLQGCAVMALPLAVLVEKAALSWWKIPAALLGAFLIYLNLFQIWQYQSTVLHYDHMNFAYYRAIFLDPDPTPLDMSLLDTREILRDTTGFSKVTVCNTGDSMFSISSPSNPEALLCNMDLKDMPPGKEQWLLISAEVKSEWGAFGAQLATTLYRENASPKETACRLENGICKKGQWNRIEYYFKIPSGSSAGQISISARAEGGQEVFLKNVSAVFLYKKRSLTNSVEQGNR
ncbi:MAG: glycosyltransferase family 39 protein [Saprospiraceae bacterium]